MKRKSLVCVLALLLVSVTVFSQEKLAGGILYGDYGACVVKAPENWGMDTQSFAPYGIYGLFYANDKTFGGSTPIIYINTQKLNTATDTELQQYIAWDTNSYKQNGYLVSEYQLKNITEKTVFTYELIQGNNYEICVYTRYKDNCFLVILSAHDEKSLTESVPQLEYIVNTMQYMDTQIVN